MSMYMHALVHVCACTDMCTLYFIDIKSCASTLEQKTLRVFRWGLALTSSVWVLPNASGSRSSRCWLTDLYACICEILWQMLSISLSRHNSNHLIFNAVLSVIRCHSKTYNRIYTTRPSYSILFATICVRSKSVRTSTFAWRWTTAANYYSADRSTLGFRHTLTKTSDRVISRFMHHAMSLFIHMTTTAPLGTFKCLFF